METETEQPKDMTELLNKKIQQVFTRESIFTESQENKMIVKMEEVIVTKDEIRT